MRAEKDLTIDEIAERLGISRQTIFYWVRDVPLKKPRRQTLAQERGTLEMQRKYEMLRDAAYEQGWEEFGELVARPTFRDFVCMYVAEGSKRSRNRVELCNSDTNVIVLADFWIREFSSNPVRYALQYHADQDVDALSAFWVRFLQIDPSSIRIQRKSNSNQLKGRQWRSRFGILSVSADDTCFRSRLQAWMDRLFEDWLDSAG
jgi:AcrR family transcriptional regulator